MSEISYNLIRLDLEVEIIGISAHILSFNKYYNMHIYDTMLILRFGSSRGKYSCMIREVTLILFLSKTSLV